MHAIETFLARPEVERLGWVLLHFVWQGALIAALCALALAALRRSSANLRYLIACSALVAMAACLPATWFLVSGHAGNSKELHDDGVAGPRGRPGGAAEAPESRGRVSPRLAGYPLAGRVSERRDHVPDTASEEPAVSLPNGREGASAVAWLDRIAAALPWLVTTWLLGVFGLSIRLAIGWRAVHRLRRRASLPADGAWQAVLSRLCDRLHIRSSVKVLESGLVDVPTMIGWLRPVILWPPALLSGLSVEQFEALLAHELAHVRRHDYLVNLIQTAIETLLFYHPAVWWLSRRIRHERECCCDDLAVAACGNRLSYAHALATLEELRSPARQLALAADGGRLLTRIRRIIGLPAARRRNGRHWLLGLALSASLLGLGFAIGLANFATGDEPATKSDSTTQVESPNKRPPNQPPAEKTDSRQTSGNIRIDLIVQKVGTNEEIIKGPTDEIGDRIKQLPHVTAVARGAMDVVSPERDLQVEAINGWPANNSPEMQDLARRFGRRIVPGDTDDRMLGAVVALKLRAKIGDTAKTFDADYAVLGVFESKTDILSEMAEFQRRPPAISAFVVSTDIPNDNWPQHQAPMKELCQRIEGLGDGIIVVRAKPPENVKWPTRVPIEISGKVVDDATGKPITTYDKEGGRVDPQNPKKIDWGTYLVSGAGDSEGRLSGSIDWYGGWRERIVASGYAPEQVRWQPLGPANTRIGGVIIRLKRMEDARRQATPSARASDSGSPTIGDSAKGHPDVVRNEDQSGGHVRDIVAAVPGVVKKVHVQHGQLVEKGQLLLTIDNPDLKAQIEDVQGKLNTAYAEWHAAERQLQNAAKNHLSSEEKERLSGQAMKHETMAESLEKQLGILREKEQQSQVVSPINGKVVTWQIEEKLLHRPVEAGQALLQVAATDAAEESKAPSAPQSADRKFDLVVQKVDDLNSLMPEDLAGRISKIPHVTAVAPGLMDVVGFEEHKLPAVVVIGWPADSPLLQDLTVKSGRRLEDRDRGMVMVGAGLAEKLKVKAGDKINVHSTDVPIVGIFESSDRFINDGIVTRLADLQEFMDAPHRITGVLVRTDIPKDDSPEHKAQMAEVRKQIEMLEKEIVAVPAGPSKEPADKPAPVKKAKPEEADKLAVFALGVQKTDVAARLNPFLSEELGERIKKLPHVTAVSATLVDFAKLDHATNDRVLVGGIQLDSPLIQKWKCVSGRLLAAGDRHKAVVDKQLAANRGWRVGTTIKLYDTDVEIVGIYESTTGTMSNVGYIEVLLSDLQEFLKLPHQLRVFSVITDIPRDGSPDHDEQEDKLRGQIYALGYPVTTFDTSSATSVTIDASVDAWSEPVGGLQARLTFERGEETNGTPIIRTYLELRNVSGTATPLEVPLDASKIEFKVTDASGKAVAQAGLPYDGAVATPGTLRLPHDSQLRLSVSGNGAGIPKDQGGLLDLASSAVWLFKCGDVGTYYLRAKIAIPKTDAHLWNGTIEIPDTRIPGVTSP
jgi:beta-lactamase regulating signal transducer with metallopeptidase domain